MTTSRSSLIVVIGSCRQCGLLLAGDMGQRYHGIDSGALAPARGNADITAQERRPLQHAGQAKAAVLPGCLQYRLGIESLAVVADVHAQWLAVLAHRDTHFVRVGGLAGVVERVL